MGVKSDDKLVMFLYFLGRDELSLGAIETILQITDKVKGEAIFSNQWLAKWAIENAARLRRKNE